MQCSNEIRPEELLYRVIKRSLPRWAQPFLGDDGYYHLTSAVFKDKNGNSVDRDGGRVEQKVVSFIRDNFGERAKGIARRRMYMRGFSGLIDASGTLLNSGSI